MSSIRLRTISDFQGHAIMVQAHCTACGHKSELHPVALRKHCAKTGVGLLVHHVERRLRCGVCKERRAHIYPGRSMPEESHG
ncbi:hypothetical protein GRI38_12665 [Altererythrobacter aurantiacus]|uniref:Uncharacterized protein n=1 Tax=Parapontixanthobacter aurantiacus TaxID=1463599 RepID=A0A844ZIS0_9SPHN|nr:hypothetical protein [Parapontixanthobacter aurantiacus]MXO86880.1 hypothetical protein [Parapontixanthobacter aurantiacus]